MYSTFLLLRIYMYTAGDGQEETATFWVEKLAYTCLTDKNSFDKVVLLGLILRAVNTFTHV